MGVRIVSGGKGKGKSTLTEHLASLSPSPLGFITDKRGECRFLRSLETGGSWLLMTPEPLFDDMIGKWYYDSSVFDEADIILSGYSAGDVFIDEIGRLELSGKGFAPALPLLLERNVNLTLSVRDEFVDSVIDAFSIRDAEIISAEEWS